MFSLEKSIADWRRELSRAGVSPDVIDELSSHLHDEIIALTRDGATEENAFRLAQSRLGNPDSLQREFQKTSPAQRTPVTIITALWIAAVAGFAWIVLRKMRLAGDSDSLLGLHIFALTIGYITAVFAGSFGIGYTMLRLLNRATPARSEALFQGLRRFNLLAAAFVLIGLVSGLIWNAKYLSADSGASPYPEVVAIQIVFNFREYGTYAVALWLAITIALQFRRPAACALVPMSIFGNLLVGLAWFGLLIFWDDLRQYSAFKAMWLVNLVLGLHLVLFIVSLLRFRSSRMIPRVAGN